MKFSLQKLSVYLVVLLAAVVAVTGCNKSSEDTTVFIPVLTTSAVVTNLTTTTAQSSGNVTNFIQGSISGYGACWSATNKTPTIADSKTSLTIANALRFTSNLTGLTANTIYYVRSYATSNDGTTNYGNVVQFTTPTTTFSIAATTTTYAGTSAAGYTEGPIKTAVFNGPQGIAIDAAGNMYIADSYNNAIRKIAAATGVVSTLAGGTLGYAEGTGAAARFYNPQYVAVDATGNVYVSDVGNNAIRKITAAGVVTTLAGGAGSGYTDATGAIAKFNNPAGLAVDAAGNVYVADRSNSVLRKITAAGVVTSYSGVRPASYSDGTNAETRFNNPTGLTIDGSGNLYVADLGNNAIRKVTTDGSTTTIVGDNTATAANILNQPVSVAIDKNGNIFIADQSGRIMEVTTSNVLWSIAGNINTTGYTEGNGTVAAFNSPKGVVTDAAGNIYVTDYNNNVVRKLVVTVKP
jgi:sugar lactone lactonase YvrE